MTAKQLHDLLGVLIQQGHARKPVRVDKSSFRHPLEDDGCVILDIEKVTLRSVPNIDDDGGSKMNKDGSESYRQTIVLDGGN
ncbi:MAG: hypothetical protein AAGA29_05725 [Planctomycetota bacterium]